MTKPTAAHVDAARRLLASETHEAASAEGRAAGARVAYETIIAQLGLLVGANAARALFARSVKLTAPDFPCLGAILLVGDRQQDLGEQLVRCLRGETPEAVTDATVALYATLLALLGTLIGDRLTAKILRDSYPTLPVSAPPKETK